MPRESQFWVLDRAEGWPNRALKWLSRHFLYACTTQPSGLKLLNKFFSSCPLPARRKALNRPLLLWWSSDVTCFALSFSFAVSPRNWALRSLFNWISDWLRSLYSYTTSKIQISCLATQNCIHVHWTFLLPALQKFFLSWKQAAAAFNYKILFQQYQWIHTCFVAEPASEIQTNDPTKNHKHLTKWTRDGHPSCKSYTLECPSKVFSSSDRHLKSSW